MWQLHHHKSVFKGNCWNVLAFFLLLTCISSLSISLITQPTEPSPPQTKIRNGSKCLNSWSPRRGPPFIRSKTWAGLSSCLNRRRNLSPWWSPDLELTKTRRGEHPISGRLASHASSLPIVCKAVGGTTLIFPSGHFNPICVLHAACTIARHHKHLKSCNLSIKNIYALTFHTHRSLSLLRDWIENPKKVYKKWFVVGVW